MAGITVTGLKEIDNVMAALPAVSQQKALRKGVRESAKQALLPRVVARAPVATGRLARSFKVRSQKRQYYLTKSGHKRIRHKVAAEVFAKYRAGDSRAPVRPDSKGGTRFYGGYVEYGTKYTPPQPHMRPAIEEGRGATLAVVHHTLTMALPGIVAEARRKGKLAEAELAALDALGALEE